MITRSIRVGNDDPCRVGGACDDMEALMKRAVLTLLVLAAAMAVPFDRVEAQTGGPTFTVENPRIDIGEVKAGSDAVGTFIFHNEGTEDVKIIKAKPS
jgi:hypothetical protein